MNDKLKEALISQNVETIKYSKIDDKKFLANQLLINKWSLQNVIDVGDVDLTRLFLEGDDSINVNEPYVGGQNWTALHESVCFFDVDHVKLLLDYNADPNSLDTSLRTPISFLYADGDPYSDHDIALEIVKMLIDRGADITLRDDSNDLQVKHILENASPEVLEIILNNDLNIDLKARYSDDDTAVHYLAQNGHPKALATIGDRDFDVNARNNRQQTPLYFAAELHQVDAVAFLLRKGAHVNAADVENCTPIYVAIRYYSIFDEESFMECVMLLLQYGADVQVAPMQDGSPRTILDLILERNHNDLCKLMLEHLAMLEASGTSLIQLIKIEINSKYHFKGYFDDCKKFLSCKVHRSDTLFELLTCNEEILVPYMRNEELVEVLNSYRTKLQLTGLYYYNRLLEKRLSKASVTAKLRDSAAVIVCKLMKISYSCHALIVDIIVKFLDDQDLNTLLNLSF